MKSAEEASDRKDNIRRVKREAEPMNEAAFAARYKSRRTETGRIEIDLTDD